MTILWQDKIKQKLSKSVNEVAIVTVDHTCLTQQEPMRDWIT